MLVFSGRCLRVEGRMSDMNEYKEYDVDEEEIFSEVEEIKRAINDLKIESMKKNILKDCGQYLLQ